MTQLRDAERHELQTLSELSHCNPFSARRIELEREVLGSDYVGERSGSWSRTEATDRNERPNVVAITRRASDTAERLCERQKAEGSLTGIDALLYDDLVTYTLYYWHISVLLPPLLSPSPGDRRIGQVYRDFRDDRERLLAPLEEGQRNRLAGSAHLFASLHQVRRAFSAIFDCLIGESRPATALRGAVWESIFTHDLRRYRRTLYARMGDLSTLITGPSGSGKELVAQAIGGSQYREFDERSGAFVGSGESLLSLNLSALSPTLIESELFGHRKGAFTGATEDRVGWLEQCPAHGAVFLDEIGELAPPLQVKLLRVAQSRDYSRLGESKPRRFVGKLLAATHRDLAAEMRAGRFREDLYYRLCSDRVVAPSLAEQLADRPEALGGLVRFLARRVLGGPAADDAESERLAAEVEGWIERSLPRGYEWPGNIRELEQCVRGVLVRGTYRPANIDGPGGESPDRGEWLASAQRGELTADGLLTAYCRHVYAREHGYEQAARVLGLDRRTVKARVTGADAGE